MTNSRSIPTGPAVPVAGTDFDFRKPRAVGGTVFDTGFADLLRDRNGVARIGLQAPSGRAITLWLDAAHQYVQIYSGDTLPDVNRRRRSLAIEPYTCAADAFNNGFGVRTIKPGDVFPGNLGSEPAGPVNLPAAGRRHGLQQVFGLEFDDERLGEEVVPSGDGADDGGDEGCELHGESLFVVRIGSWLVS